MSKPSPARQRTLDLHARATSFSVGVNAACPTSFENLPSETVWRQLVRAADSVSNNLIEADNGSSDDEFVYKMRVTLREAKESRQCLSKIRRGKLMGYVVVADLEREAGELSAIFATIVTKVLQRLDREKRDRPKRRKT